MRTFRYVAADAQGALHSGHALATSEHELLDDLERRGLFLTRVREVRRVRGRTSGRLSRSELVLFTTQLATVLGAGLPLVEGLEGIGRRAPSPRLAALTEALIARLQAGEAFSEALAAHPASFPAVYRAAVRAGEAAGALDVVLARLAGHLEWARAMRATTAQALVYPALLCAAVCGLVAILLGHVLPKLSGMLPPGELPAETRAVLAASDFLTANGALLATGLVALAAGAVLAQRFPRTRAATQRLLLSLPLLGDVAWKLATSRFAATAATLHAAGCDVFTVLDVGGETCGNAAVAEALGRASRRVRAGESIAEALAVERLADPLLVQMVGVGEESGRLAETLERLSTHLNEDVPRAVKRMLGLLEPGLLLGAGAVVAFILLATLLPVFEMYDRLG